MGDSKSWSSLSSVSRWEASDLTVYLFLPGFTSFYVKSDERFQKEIGL